MIEEIRLADLSAHPDNPRLAPREDVVEAIVAQINGAGFDPAHALIVRPFGDGYQIISGHHRITAADRAGLAAVPCWVREMDDETAFMALVTSNAQGELTPLERGMHALKATEKGKQGALNVSAYAGKVGMSQQLVSRQIQAAEVWGSYHSSGNFEAAKLPFVASLAELHAAPSWLWPALVAELVARGWTVEIARSKAAAFKGAEEPPTWANGEAIAKALVSGAVKPADVKRMAAAVENARLSHEDLIEQLQAGLRDGRPANLSATQSIVLKLEEEEARREAEERQRSLVAQRETERKAAEQAAARDRRLKAVELDEWKELDDETKADLLGGHGEVPSGGFNKQTNDAIEWADWSWNPVTGCLHDCPYCYARDIAQSPRYAKEYTTGFRPTLKPRSLLKARGKKPPKDSDQDARKRNVFTCSMADLFGRWVPLEWIEAVFREIENAPDWNFLCLTKFPKRMAEFRIPHNAWMGTTVDLQARVPAAEAAFERVECGVKWLSVEPLIEPLKFKRLDLFDWVVIGGASRSTQTPEWFPPFAWIMDLTKQAQDAGCKVYFKTNLLGSRLLEMPFDAKIPVDPQEAPKAFHYLGKAKTADQAHEK